MKAYHKCTRPFLYAGLVAVTLSAGQGAYGAGPANVEFSGAMVAQPCTLPDENSNIEVEFGTVINKNLYSSARTNRTNVSLTLEDCDLTMDQPTVSISFSGPPSTQLPGLIALDPSSQASGVAIGLETADGKLLPLDKNSEKQLLITGSNTLNFKAFVQGEPDAIENKSITLGPFSALAMFTLKYE